MVKDIFEVDGLRVYGNSNKLIKRVAICPGAGSSHIVEALNENCDVLITGDVSHHNALDAVAQGLAVIDASHYGIEKIFVPCVNLKTCL